MPKFKVRATLITERTLMKEINAKDENDATSTVLTTSKSNEGKYSRELKVLTK